MLGIVGRKAGMTRVFAADGRAIPVTVIDARANPIVQIRTVERDGYSALQVSFGEKKPQNVSKAIKNHYTAATLEPGRKLVEFRFPNDTNVDELLNTLNGETATRTENTESDAAATETKNTTPIRALTVNQFQIGGKVDVSGITIGKGFAGTIKRHHFAKQDATHGNSVSHRHPGSIGQRQTPGRVFIGKKMSGHLGHDRRTVQNLEIVGVDRERQLLLVKGAVPGARSGYLIVRPAARQKQSS